MRRIKVIAAGFLLLLQPVYTVLTALPAYAAAGVPGSIAINELSASTAPDWVELYNTTSNTVDVTGWRIQNAAMGEQAASGSIVGHGFLLIEAENLLNDTGDMIRLLDSDGNQIDGITFGNDSTIVAPSVGQSAARNPDGGAVWVLGAPTKGYTNAIDVVSPTAPSGGDPNEISKTSLQFAFAWQASTDNNPAALRYELRVSKERSQVETDSAWKSELRHETSLPFTAIPGAGDGDWYWQVRAVDSAGNQSSWSEVWHMIVDTNGPGITVHQPTAILHGGPGTEIVSFEATLWDRSGVSSWAVMLDGVDITSQLTVTHHSSDIALATSFDTAGLTDGDHTIGVVAADQLGHTGEQLRLFSVDKTAPALQTNVDEGSLLRGVTQITLNAEEAHPGEYSLTIFKDDVAVTAQQSALQSKENTDELESSANVLSYNWDTTQLADGAYQLRFFGKDAVGNESTLIRNVIVDNIPSFGGGTVTIDNAPPLTDPLLDQLSKQLAQPFITPKAFEIAPIETSNIADQASQEAAKNAKLEIPATDDNADLSPVEPSEGGWRIFGVLWYWWLLLGATIGVTYRRVRKAIIPVATGAL